MSEHITHYPLPSPLPTNLPDLLPPPFFPPALPPNPQLTHIHGLLNQINLNIQHLYTTTRHHLSLPLSSAQIQQVYDLYMSTYCSYDQARHLVLSLLEHYTIPHTCT